MTHSQAEHRVSSPTSSFLTDAHTRRPQAGHSGRLLGLRNTFNLPFKGSGVAYENVTLARRSRSNICFRAPPSLDCCNAPPSTRIARHPPP
ncbi:hypothetical protein NMY22_g13874 [Coprinellus aureogranulatus]|nr:hypothetical protein NMY22_g13874 [Coprinellus aureogranulatus]